MSEQEGSSATTDGDLARDIQRESDEMQRGSVASHIPPEKEETNLEQAKEGLSPSDTGDDQREASGDAQQDSVSNAMSVTSEANLKESCQEKLAKEATDNGEHAISGLQTQNDQEDTQKSVTEKSFQKAMTLTKKERDNYVECQNERELEEEVFYDYSSMHAKPVTVGIDDDILTLHHSFGFECRKRSNLASLDNSTLLFAAGNLLTLLDIDSLQQHYRWTLGGGGVGAVAVHPRHNYFAVGEKGENPVIAIYTYPELVLHRVLRGGTEQQYSHMDFSPREEHLLASVGGYPDYMLTVWDWMKQSIVLRSKAFSQDIYRVSFSPKLPGQLTTSGTGHIRFWKMSSTFTGLKLQGYLGKFGRTELSDISAYVELPDGKVLSGTEWGNLLLWDGGFIKVEIAKKGKKFCHIGVVEMLYLDEGELISAGEDGFIRIWDFETIDNADITEGSSVFEMEPLVEIKVGSDVSIKSLCRSTDPETPTLWFAQDSKGAIWKVDIVPSYTRKSPEKLVAFHSGEIMNVQCSPNSLIASSIAEDGSVRVYDIKDKAVLCHSKFAGGGSVLYWAPLSMDSNGLTLLTGFSDGVFRVVKIDENRLAVPPRGGVVNKGLSLLHVSKPHTSSITAIAVDQEGKLLATGSKDCTVFLMNVAEFTPIGFIQTPAPVSCMTWSSAQSPRLLVCCQNATMLEFEPPCPRDTDVSESYLVQPHSLSCGTFTSIKDRLRKEEADAKRAAEKEKKKKEKEALREAEKAKRKEELGDDYVSEEEDDEGEQEDIDETQEENQEKEGAGEDHEDEEERPTGPSPILAAFYQHNSSSQFWLSMGGYDAGYLYCCSLENAGSDPAMSYEPPHSVPLPPIAGRDVPFHSMVFSKCGYYLFLGAENGCVRVHYLRERFSLAGLDCHWSLNIHDNQYGRVMALATSFDDSYLVTAGADGNIFVFAAHLPSCISIDVVTGAVKPGQQPLEVPRRPVRDIEDSTHYSIEDSKQKEERDRRLKEAEKRKQQVRREITQLQKQFAAIQQRSLDLPLHLRLPATEFVMDPSMEQELDQQRKEKLHLVEREMAWESERHAISLRKLQKRYTEIVECERIVVWTFSGQLCVSSLRMPAPSEQYKAMLASLLLSEEAGTPQISALGKRSDGQRRAHQLEESGPNEPGGVADQEKEEAKGVLQNKSEVRRLRRECRKKEWEEFNHRKPGEQFEDPEEVEAIHLAQQKMGDYKLKTANDFVVSEEQRVSTDKKRCQLLLLRNTIIQTKRAYNQKLLELRDRKAWIVSKIAEIVKELQDVHGKLPLPQRKPVPRVPKLKTEEVPEKRVEFTDESLLAFKKKLEQQLEEERLAKAGGGNEGFFGGFQGDGQEEEEQEKVAEADQSSLTASSASKEGSLYSATFEGMYSELESVIRTEGQERLLFRQEQLLRQIQELIISFDNALGHLHHEKCLMDVMSKTADLKLITLFEELELLKEFEKRETNFTSKYRSKKREKSEMERKIDETEWLLQEKDKLVNKLLEEEKVLHNTFLESVGENNKFKDFLLKVFRKKIKRVRVKQQQVEAVGDDSGDESELESDSEDWSSSEEESDEEGLDDSVCPPGCDPALYELALQMRDQKLNVEEALIEDKKALENVRRELEGMRKKAKTVESHVKTALADLQAFQLKKQQRMNELDQVVVLKLHQIFYCQPGGKPPINVSPCLVFSAPAMTRLTKRIGELVWEKLKEKKRYRELRLQHVKLSRERKVMELKEAELDEKVNQMMVLKFGRVVNLEALEGLATNKLIGELEDKLQVQEEKSEKGKKTVERKVMEAKQKLLEVTQVNTHRTNQLHQLLTYNRQIEKQLNARQKSTEVNVCGKGSLFEPEEKARLMQIVHLQSNEIENLRHEIKILSQKGGSVLPPAQPPGATAAIAGASRTLTLN